VPTPTGTSDTAAADWQAAVDQVAREGEAKAGAGLTPPATKPDEGEGKAGAGSTTVQPEATTSGVARETALRDLEPADQKAYYTYAHAETKLGKTTDRQAYQWLTDNGLPDEKDSPEVAKELAGYKLPSFATWSKQLRTARKALGEQKHTRRAGRSLGKSIVSASDLDSERDAD
jgi:hypothetical protein